MNCILNSGEVPDLFDNEEIDGIAMELKAAASEFSIPDTRQDVYSFFIIYANIDGFNPATDVEDPGQLDHR